MKTLFRMLLALSLVGAATLPSLAAASPEGVWEIESRDSRYRVTLCGDDATALCGELIWLGNGGDRPENLPYLNTLLIDHAPLVGPQQWKGELKLFGQKAQGTITQVEDNWITLKGCVLFVVCKTYQMYRYAD